MSQPAKPAGRLTKSAGTSTPYGTYSPGPGCDVRSNVVSLTRSSAGHAFTGYPQYCRYFYDWQIGSGCVGGATRTAIQVNLTPGPAPTLRATTQPAGGAGQ